MAKLSWDGFAEQMDAQHMYFFLYNKFIVPSLFGARLELGFLLQMSSGTALLCNPWKRPKVITFTDFLYLLDWLPDIHLICNLTIVFHNEAKNVNDVPIAMAEQIRKISK